MTVSEFLGKADALQAKGMMAMFSSDLTLVKKEIEGASAGYRSDVAMGKPPKSCPPPKGTVKIGSDDILANFRTIPVAQRGSTTVRAAFSAYMVKRFPCKS